MTSFFEHQRLSFKRNYLRNLILLASADGHLDDKEKDILFLIGKKRGLKEWQVEELLADKSQFEIFIPESFGNRMNLLFDLMQIIYADGKIEKEEVAFAMDTLKAFDLPTTVWEELKELFEGGTPSSSTWHEYAETLRPVDYTDRLSVL